MRHLAALVLIATIAAPQAYAQDPEDGLSLMERGAQLFMEGILKEMEPAIDELSELRDQMGPALRNFAQEMGPKLTELLEEVEDWSAYEAPEVLPNGDIIIRRKPDLPQEEPETAEEAMPQIEL
ncbi:MAG: hypothetical protein HKN30_04150 [Sulfitobacter sp.]|nr:hypothetical protein [Sulfitobacter sp.]